MIYVDIKDNIKDFLASVGTASAEQLLRFFDGAAPQRAIENSIYDLKRYGVAKEEDGYYRLITTPKITRDELERRSIVLDCLTQLKSSDVIAIKLFQYPVYFIAALEDSFISYSLVRQTPDKQIIRALLTLPEYVAGDGHIKHYAVVLEDKVGKEVLDTFDGYYLVTEKGAMLYEDQA